MHHGFFSEIIVRKPELFAAMLAFNRAYVFAQGNAAWLDGLPGLNVAALLPFEVARKALTGTGERGAEAGFWDFSQEHTRLALLDAVTLQRLGVFYGAAQYASSLCRVITGAEVLMLKQGIGEEAYRYALARGKFHFGKALTSPIDAPASVLADTVWADGLAALRAVYLQWPQPLRRCAAPLLAQVLASFPQQAEKNTSSEWGGDDEPGEGAALEARSVWKRVKKILLKEVAPQWAPLFD